MAPSQIGPHNTVFVGSSSKLVTAADNRHPEQRIHSESSAPQNYHAVASSDHLAPDCYLDVTQPHTYPTTVQQKSSESFKLPQRRHRSTPAPCTRQCLLSRSHPHRRSCCRSRYNYGSPCRENWHPRQRWSHLRPGDASLRPCPSPQSAASNGFSQGHILCSKRRSARKATKISIIAQTHTQ